MADAALRQFVDPAMVVQQIGQIGFAFHQFPAEIAFHERARIVHKSLARQIFKDVEHLFGVFLVLDQFAEMLKRLERAELWHHAVRVGEDGRDRRGGHGGENLVSNRC